MNEEVKEIMNIRQHLKQVVAERFPRLNETIASMTTPNALRRIMQEVDYPEPEPDTFMKDVFIGLAEHIEHNDLREAP